MGVGWAEGGATKGNQKKAAGACKSAARPRWGGGRAALCVPLPVCHSLCKGGGAGCAGCTHAMDLRPRRAGPSSKERVRTLPLVDVCACMHGSRCREPCPGALVPRGAAAAGQGPLALPRHPELFLSSPEGRGVQACPPIQCSPGKLCWPAPPACPASTPFPLSLHARPNMQAARSLSQGSP